MYRKFLFVCLVLVLTLSACSFHITFPITVKTGPLQEDEITLPIPPEAGTIDMKLSFGVGTLKLHSGTDSLVSGTASYNIEDFKPIVTATGNKVTIEQGDWQMTGIPEGDNIKNEWDLSLGPVPMDLTIEAGAYKAEYDFGGLALENLTIQDGASQVDLSFSAPNEVEMTLLKYQTGASNVSMVGLAYANFSTFDFNSGAGNYTLDFTGELKRDASVNIETGVSNVALVIPDGIPVQITVDGGLSNVTYGGSWERNGSVYTQEGTGPALTIVVEMGVGNLTLTR